jgi:lipid II:glycine glycyltransferase (peptidoglycan interpeptide bridge formation enzyme)
MRTLTMRAKVYLNRGYPGFVRELGHVLADEGAAYAVFGDALRPLPDLAVGTLRAGLVTQHRVVHDARRDDDTVLARMDIKPRSNLRRAWRTGGVIVSEVTTARDLDAFCALNVETAARMRGRDLVAALPDTFFQAVLDRMVPTRDAVILLARAGDVPLAGALLFRNGDCLTYYHGVSTRDRSVARLQGPTQVFMHAIRLTREMGLRYFDHGAVTVTDDAAHPHYSVYDYKRRLGGCVEPLACAQLVLSPARHAFQQRVMMPLWKRLYPLYLRLARVGEATAGAIGGSSMLA